MINIIKSIPSKEIIKFYYEENNKLVVVYINSNSRTYDLTYDNLNKVIDIMEQQLDTYVKEEDETKIKNKVRLDYGLLVLLNITLLPISFFVLIPPLYISLITILVIKLEKDIRYKENYQKYKIYNTYKEEIKKEIYEEAREESIDINHIDNFDLHDFNEEFERMVPKQKVLKRYYKI